MVRFVDRMSREDGYDKPYNKNHKENLKDMWDLLDKQVHLTYTENDEFDETDLSYKDMLKITRNALKQINLTIEKMKKMLQKYD